MSVTDFKKLVQGSKKVKKSRELQKKKWLKQFKISDIDSKNIQIEGYYFWI